MFVLEVNSMHCQDTIRQARTQQIQATDLLARLLQAPDAKSVAAEHTESLTEEFFMMSSTYLEMVGAFCAACGHRQRVVLVPVWAGVQSAEPTVLAKIIFCDEGKVTTLSVSVAGAERG